MKVRKNAYGEVKQHRLLVGRDPYADALNNDSWSQCGRWPADWIAVEGTYPYVAAYRLCIACEKVGIRRVHVSADERYELFLNGVRIGRGAERGEVEHWPFDTYDLLLQQGENVIVARVWSLGDGAPYAQISLRHGFLFSPDDPNDIESMATGHANWKGKILDGYHFKGPQQAWGTGLNVEIDGMTYPWGVERGDGEWGQADRHGIARSPMGKNDVPPQRLLVPSILPPMFAETWPRGLVRHVAEAPNGPTHGIAIQNSDHLATEETDWQSLISGSTIMLPPHTRRRVVIDFQDYICAYPELTVSGGQGSSFRVHWQESLFETETSIDKGHRDAIEGKFFSTIWEWQDGIGDTFRTDGGLSRCFTPLWWQCGRYVELLVETAHEPLVIERLEFIEDRYPFENEAPFEASDERLAEVAKLGFRTLQMCAHETYMDCPYFEQLQYAGDTRLQALVTYVTSSDDRLPRQALLAFDRSRRQSGVTQSRYPSHIVQVIPPFSLLWVGMVHDFARWRGDPEFVRSLMPGVRSVLDWFRARRINGLVEAPGEWNYVDWVPEWVAGMPFDTAHGAGAAVNRQFEVALREAAELETWLGEPEMATRNSRHADEISVAIHEAFWNEQIGMYADDRGHTSFSEHVQALFILAKEVPPSVVKGLLESPHLHRTTIYFAHYLFEAYAKIGRIDRILNRLDLWHDLLDRGLRTTVEMPEPTRSDCHAWGAHPVYHFAANLLGIRPEGFGCDQFRITPNIGSLAWARGGVATAQGVLSVAVANGQVEIVVPAGTTAIFQSSVLGPGGYTFMNGVERHQTYCIGGAP